MRIRVLTVALLTLGLVAVSPASAKQIPGRCTTANAPRLCGIHFYKHRADHYRTRMGESRLAYHWVAEAYPGRRDRILAYWHHTAQRAHHRLELYQRMLQQSPAGAIQAAFGAAASAAIAVATCESGLRVTAVNGEHFGLFQLSSYIRYSRQGIPHAGSSTDASLQARAAAAVYRQDGNSWREWVCQP